MISVKEQAQDQVWSGPRHKVATKLKLPAGVRLDMHDWWWASMTREWRPGHIRDQLHSDVQCD